MKSLVVTSINPREKLDYQKSCFYKWQDLGYVVKTFNCGEERRSLLEQGFGAEDVIELSEDETAAELFGRPVPRILPVLNRADKCKFESIILVNSDIFPAHNKPITNYLSSLAETIALTRNECIEVDAIRYADSYAYRGGLDIFFFTANGLKMVLGNIVGQPVADRMSFGVPGWDFYLGHQVAYVHKGFIMDGEVLFHKVHKTTYSDINEFSFYAREMYASGMYKSESAIELANEFSAYIRSQCVENSRFSRFLKAMFYVKPEGGIENEQELQSILLIKREFQRVLEKFKININYDDGLIRVFIRSQLERVHWSSAELHKENKFNQSSPITAYLSLLMLQLIIKEHTGKLNIMHEYPEGNVHGVALKQILNNTTGEKRLYYIIRLFSSELVNYSIFNDNLFKFISLNAETTESLNLCSAIFSLCNKGLIENV
ncbi:MAG: hypothetical protein OEY89_14895 [Gammaproteobacteria bacterium]|nr:hypothetical protein [Gammaproteobacteria bacterium]